MDQNNSPELSGYLFNNMFHNNDRTNATNHPSFSLRYFCWKWQNSPNWLFLTRATGGGRQNRDAQTIWIRVLDWETCLLIISLRFFVLLKSGTSWLAKQLSDNNLRSGNRLSASKISGKSLERRRTIIRKLLENVRPCFCHFRWWA